MKKLLIATIIGLGLFTVKAQAINLSDIIPENTHLFENQRASNQAVRLLIYALRHKPFTSLNKEYLVFFSTEQKNNFNQIMLPYYEKATEYVNLYGSKNKTDTNIDDIFKLLLMKAFQEGELNLYREGIDYRIKNNHEQRAVFIVATKEQFEIRKSNMLRIRRFAENYSHNEDLITEHCVNFVTKQHDQKDLLHLVLRESLSYNILNRAQIYLSYVKRPDFQEEIITHYKMRELITKVRQAKTLKDLYAAM